MEVYDRPVEVIAPETTSNMNTSQQRTMILPRFMGMQHLQQPSPSFPLLVFFFPRIALFMMSLREEADQRGIGVQNITQLIRDERGRIIEIVEFRK